MSHCLLIPKSFAQIESAQSLFPSNATECATNAAPSASSMSPTYTYTGSGYRSVAFGTWAVGDASRCFEGRRRDKSATAPDRGRMESVETKEKREEEEGNGRIKAEEDGGTRHEKEEEEEGGGRRGEIKGRREEEKTEDGRREEEGEGRKRRGNREGKRRKANGKDGKRGGTKREPSNSHPSSSADRSLLSSSNHRSLPVGSRPHRHSSQTLSLSSCDISISRKAMQTAIMKRMESDLYSSSEYVRHYNSSGTDRRAVGSCPGKESPSFPATVPSSASAHRHQNNTGGCSLEALFLPPFRCPVPLSPCPSRISCPPVRRLLPPQHNCWSPHSLCQSPHQYSFIIDPMAKEKPRMRTKSLDNGLKLSFGTTIRRRKDRICEGVPPKECQAEDVPGSRKSAIWESEHLSTGGGESRLETAKNFLRRFYNQSTLRLTGRRRRRGNGAKSGDADKETEAPSMYSSALGPFFEMRKPQPEEVPFLPYNIHYTIESTDEASDPSDEEADSAVASVRRPRRPASPQSEWSCTPTCSSATITTSPNLARNNANCLANNWQQRQIAVDDPFKPCQDHQQQHHHAAVGACGLRSSVPQMAPSSPQHFAVPSPLRHQQSATDSLLNETVATTPSVGYGSLKSSSDSSEGRRENEGTTVPRRMGPAEKRFADWNELFQYLKREINEMNVRDAQILRRLEGIQFELNGVRQMNTQQR